MRTWSSHTDSCKYLKSNLLITTLFVISRGQIFAHPGFFKISRGFIFAQPDQIPIKTLEDDPKIGAFEDGNENFQVWIFSHGFIFTHDFSARNSRIEFIRIKVYVREFARNFIRAKIYTNKVSECFSSELFVLRVWENLSLTISILGLLTAFFRDFEKWNFWGLGAFLTSWYFYCCF